MWGGGFTETVRFLWEKHRFPLHGKSLVGSLHLQELLVAGRPGLAQHLGLPVPLADPAPPL